LVVGVYPVTFKIAIMQPYFMPYAGYFRLFAEADLFVIYDCVQFPRRGWVHRNQFTTAQGERDWLTLPLRKAPQQVLIRDLAFVADATKRLQDAVRRFPALQAHGTHPLMQAVLQPGGMLVDYITRLLAQSCALLRLPFVTCMSSSLAIDPTLHGQDRIIAIARAMGATHYLNLPGGRALYDAEAFSHAGLELRFLPDYKGNYASLLERILLEDADALGKDIAIIV
jgi:hypothetical protein